MGWTCTGEDNQHGMLFAVVFYENLPTFGGCTRRMLSCSQNKGIHCCNLSYGVDIGAFMMKSVFHMSSNVCHMTRMAAMKWPTHPM